jgi:hypothetical protein
MAVIKRRVIDHRRYPTWGQGSSLRPECRWSTTWARTSCSSW